MEAYYNKNNVLSKTGLDSKDSYQISESQSSEVPSFLLIARDQTNSRTRIVKLSLGCEMSSSDLNSISAKDFFGQFGVSNFSLYKNAADDSSQ